MIAAVMANGLKFLRERAGWTQEEAGKRLGYSTSGYGKIERSNRGLDAEFIKRVCELFGVKPEEVVSDPTGVFAQDIDLTLLAKLVADVRKRLGVLPHDEAVEMILSLISGARTPPPADKDRSN